MKMIINCLYDMTEKKRCQSLNLKSDEISNKEIDKGKTHKGRFDMAKEMNYI